jgi:hypothetical protein
VSEPEAGRTSRQAAYADLVSAVLDLRGPRATQEFDRAVADAVAAGLLPDAVARELKWLQRASLRALVDHAERVLPSTLVALEGGDLETQLESRVEPDTDEVPAAPVDLTARRLLVAGLRPIDDPPFP